MSTPYRSTQVDVVPPILVTAALAIIPAVLGIEEVGVLIPIFVLVIVLNIAIWAVLFSTLVIEVNSEVVQVSFGMLPRPGVTIPLEDITACAPVAVKVRPFQRSSGQYTETGKPLYYITGKQVVELTLKDGSSVQVGTNEPEAVCAAIRAQQGQG